VLVTRLLAAVTTREDTETENAGVVARQDAAENSIPAAIQNAVQNVVARQDITDADRRRDNDAAIGDAVTLAIEQIERQATGRSRGNRHRNSCERGECDECGFEVHGITSVVRASLMHNHEDILDIQTLKRRWFL
jgi:hypothetical protein